jgi:hypothetical protein
MEYIYKLNLPPLTDILQEGVAEKIFNGGDSSFKRVYDPQQIIKSEWLTWNDIQFNHIDFFYKNNFVGIVHVDAEHAWGINWIHNGLGKLEYWLPNDITKVGNELDALGSPRCRYIANTPPIKRYTTPPGAYLVNAGIPHLASGKNGRYALSLRSRHPQNQSLRWDDVVTKFKHLII